MGSVNKVLLVGRLGADVELKYTPQGNRAVASMSIATSEGWKDKSGQKQERTEWHKVVAWGEQAENCAKYLSKGSLVHVEGKLQTRSYDDKTGTKRYVTEVVADRVTFLGGGRNGEDDREDGGQRGRRGWGGGQRSQGATPNNNDDRPPVDDDVPF